jgi:hypothetical protein
MEGGVRVRVGLGVEAGVVWGWVGGWGGVGCVCVCVEAGVWGVSSQVVVAGRRAFMSAHMVCVS